jgi:hypothetical protein
MMKRLSASTVLILYIILSSCAATAETIPAVGDQENKDPAPAPPAAYLESINLQPEKPFVIMGKTVQFVAIGNYSDNTTRDLTSSVTWGTSDKKIAVIDAGGLATAEQNRGTITVTAAFEGKTGYARLKVIPFRIVSLSVDPVKPVIAKGMSQQFSATGHYNDGTKKDLTSSAKWESWSATLATINSQGVATARSRKGAATITATYGLARGITKIITDPHALVSISITPDTASIHLGKTQQFTATGRFADNTTGDITSSVVWASSDPGVAAINAQGLATAVTPRGTTTITASLKYKTGSSLLNAVPRLIAITVQPANGSVRQMEAQQFKAIGKFDDNSSEDLTSAVTWNSGSPFVAPINELGSATGIDVGSTRISASYQDKAGFAKLDVVLRAIRRTDPASVPGGDGKDSFQWPVSRFTNPDGTTPAAGTMVVDQITGLIWTTNANTPGPGACASEARKTWQGAAEHIACLNKNRFLGHSDWRLPSRNELFSLIDYQQSVPSPTVYTKGFSYVQRFYGHEYWLSSPSNNSIFADLSYGTVYYGDKSFRSYVWPVRGGNETIMASGK